MASHGFVGRSAALAASIGIGTLMLAGCGTNALPNTQTDRYQPAAAAVPVNYAVPAGDQNATYVTAEPARVRPVTYRRAPSRVVRRGRSWQKSALIIGSSAGIGAGVGAAVGGKKGALIGAALGGGGATIWDQLTRRR